ncbi:hypothetical protein C8R47DRAFT_77781 [Mycena vitilis]|nr:hypothetical protein C8R47DRAFT_77781 [Mycena vitilis]
MHSERRSPGLGFTTSADEHSNMLDKLHDIPLKGFPEMEGTPTSATMSLPTPECQHVPLPPLDSLQVPQPDPTSYLFRSDEQSIVMPGAPRMKDYDSFTDGSAVGSFDSIPNEHGEPIYRISEDALAFAALPLHDAVLFIEQWRQDVDYHLLPQEPVVEAAPLQPIPRTRAPAPQLPTLPIIDLTSESEAGTTPTNTKRPRPRSNSPEEGDEARRNRRARANSPPSPSPRARARAQSFSSASSGIHNSFTWVDRGPPPNANRRQRAPSRANTAPPD